MDRKTYRQSRRLLRSMYRAISLECFTAARGCLHNLTAQWCVLRDAGINPFDFDRDRPGAAWIVGQVPRDNGNFKAELKRRAFDRMLTQRTAYQPGPKPGQLPA